MTKRSGDTLCFGRRPTVSVWASAGGKKENEGPLAGAFDLSFEENDLGDDSWEKAESDLLGRCARECLKKGGAPAGSVSIAFAGDLQAQCTASSYALRGLDIPFAGLYGACSTMAEGLALAACFCASNLAEKAMAMTCSHFCAAERQFRTPLEYGGQRTPTAQWTATAAGCCLVVPVGPGPQVASVTFGRVRDYQVTDINNMGAAMAPAAAQTILNHLRDTGTAPADYDAVYTGDLGRVGSELLHQILEKENVRLENHHDCGLELYDLSDEQIRAGGSGAGCSAAVLCAGVLPRLASGEWKRVLFLSTGALMSQTTFLQKESIPGIAHAVELWAPGREEEPM